MAAKFKITETEIIGIETKINTNYIEINIFNPYWRHEYLWVKKNLEISYQCCGVVKKLVVSYYSFN